MKLKERETSKRSKAQRGVELRQRCIERGKAIREVKFRVQKEMFSSKGTTKLVLAAAAI